MFEAGVIDFRHANSMLSTLRILLGGRSAYMRLWLCQPWVPLTFNVASLLPTSYGVLPLSFSVLWFVFFRSYCCKNSQRFIRFAYCPAKDFSGVLVPVPYFLPCCMLAFLCVLLGKMRSIMEINWASTVEQFGQDSFNFLAFGFFKYQKVPFTISVCF